MLEFICFISIILIILYFQKIVDILFEKLENKNLPLLVDYDDSNLKLDIKLQNKNIDNLIKESSELLIEKINSYGHPITIYIKNKKYVISLGDITLKKEKYEDFTNH